ncbi:MAG: transglycosylase SLT domain-containing protein [Bacillota bacterium]|nr:transglycosylase SLT domain-containing protein [Bacillota bacterium]
MLNNRKAVIAIVLMVVMVFSSFIMILNNKNEEINALEKEIMKNENVIKEDLEVKISILGSTINELEKKKNSLEKRLNTLIIDLNIDGLTAEEIKKVGDISLNTPIDIETSAVLVKVAKKYDLNPSLILSIMELESNFDRYEVGAANDRGYMQIIPSTEKWLANEFSIEYDPSKIFEAEYNIELAGAYLSLLKNAYGDNYSRILSEYNRGPYNLARYYEEYKTYSTSYSKVVLNKEKKYLTFNN